MRPWEALACKRLCPLRFFACIHTAVRKWELFLFSQRFAEGFANLPNAWILMRREARLWGKMEAVRSSYKMAQLKNETIWNEPKQ